jgi:hypothetical protein
VITTGKYIGQIIHTQQTHLERMTPASHAMKQTQTFPTLETANREAIGASEHLFWCPFAHRYIIGIFSGNGTHGTMERGGDGEMIRDKSYL